jgi:hypothetical protein
VLRVSVAAVSADFSDALICLKISRLLQQVAFYWRRDPDRFEITYARIIGPQAI